jgi:glucose/arabinose dehydrogenase
LFAAATLVASSLFFVSLGAQNRIGRGDVKELFDTQCASCHGVDLAGGSGSSLIDDEWTHGGSDEDLARVIREGITDTEMVAWGQVLDAEQIRSLVIYIREQGRLARLGETRQGDRSRDGLYVSQGHSFRLETLAEGEDILWSMDFMPDGSMLITQRNGVLWHFVDGEMTAIKGTPEVWQHGQGGLLEVALHPDYANNGWVYLSYSEHTGAMEDGKEAGMTTVVRGRIVEGQWADQQRIFRADDELHTSTGAHYGSRFVFENGYLFFSIGDRGRKDQAQDLGRVNGKIHRLHDDGSIPGDNPFVDTPGALPSIWSYGHRNPQGMDRDPATGALWATEHGPRGGDELNHVRPGLNYGWPVITYGMNYNGTPITSETAREGMEQPALYWTPSIAVAGIDFYEGDAFPAWKGKLLVGGMASNEVHLLTLDDGAVTADDVILRGAGRVRDVASGPDGNVYLLLTAGDPRRGRVARLVPAAKPNVWVYTDHSDPRDLRAHNHPQNDPDDIVSLAALLLSAARFNIEGIVYSSTNRRGLGDATPFVEEALAEAYRRSVAAWNRNGGDYQPDIPFIRSSITREAQAQAFDPERDYADIGSFEGMPELVSLLEREPVYVLNWGPLTESAILVRHLLGTGNEQALANLVIVTHWTKSATAQGTPEAPFEVANCRDDARACAWLHESAQADDRVRLVELGPAGQTGIVNGSKSFARYADFETSPLGQIFYHAKFFNGAPDQSDASSFWLLTPYGADLGDYPHDGSLDIATERANVDRFARDAEAIVADLWLRARAAAGAQPFSRQEISGWFNYLYVKKGRIEAHLAYPGRFQLQDASGELLLDEVLDKGNHAFELQAFDEFPLQARLESEGIEKHMLVERP